MWNLFFHPVHKGQLHTTSTTHQSRVPLKKKKPAFPAFPVPESSSVWGQGHSRHKPWVLPTTFSAHQNGLWRLWIFHQSVNVDLSASSSSEEDELCILNLRLFHVLHFAYQNGRRDKLFSKRDTGYVLFGGGFSLQCRNARGAFEKAPTEAYPSICFVYPIGSMYGIYANIGGIWMVNVTIYSIHGSYGYLIIVWLVHKLCGKQNVTTCRSSSNRKRGQWLHRKFT